MSFDWTYTFLHSWYRVEADLYVFADGSSGTTSIHEVDFFNAEFTDYRTVSGSSTVWVEEGYDFGFEIGGSNFDYSGLLNGTLTVSNLLTDILPPYTSGHDPAPGVTNVAVDTSHLEASNHSPIADALPAASS